MSRIGNYVVELEQNKIFWIRADKAERDDLVRQLTDLAHDM